MEKDTVLVSEMVKKNNIVRTLLGDNYANLPETVRTFHEHPELEWSGEAEVKGSNHFFFKIIRYFLGLPPPLGKMPVKVNVKITQSESVWTRSFGKFRFQSALGCSLKTGLMYERIGPLRFYFKLRLSDETLHWDINHITLFHIPLPRFFNPSMIAEESASLDGYYFKAYIKLPLFGVLLDYEGNLNSQAIAYQDSVDFK